MRKISKIAKINQYNKYLINFHHDSFFKNFKKNKTSSEENLISSITKDYKKKTVKRFSENNDFKKIKADFAHSLNYDSIVCKGNTFFLKKLYNNYRCYSSPYYLILNSFFNNTKRNWHIPQKTLQLNFRKGKFFPVIRDSFSGETHTFLSLGIMSKFFQKGKSFTKNKAVYLLVAGFFRKMLLFSSLKNMYFVVKKTPIYFKEIMNALNSPVASTYKHPFMGYEVDEKFVTNPFTFPFIIFQNNKPYGPLKLRKKGRLKRKISRRIISMNRVLD